MNPERRQRSVHAAALGLITNGLLAGIKLAAGIFGNSYALIADAIESFADIITSKTIFLLTDKSPLFAKFVYN